MLLWDGSKRLGIDGTMLLGLVFHTKKPSSKDSVSKPRKRVQWTRFLGIETEFNELGFQALKPSPLNSISRLRGHSNHLSCWQNNKIKNPEIESSELELLNTKLV